MKKFIFLSAILLVGSVAYAQAPDDKSPAQNPNTSRSAASGGRKTTMVGCLKQNNDKFVLSTTDPIDRPSEPSGQAGRQTDEHSMSGKHSVELESTQDLKEHVGHTVKVTGTMERSSSASSQKTSEKHRSTFHVTDIQMVSEGCSPSESR